MCKTLGCLVAAMSGTAALLGWMDPSASRYTFPMLPNEIVQLARSRVMDGIVIHEEQWLDVEVSTAPERILGSSMLAAPTGSAGWHFCIDRNGYLYRGAAWLDQRVAAWAPGTVRILVLEPDDGQIVSSAQLFCAQALVSALNAALGARDTLLPIRLQQELAQAFDASPVGYVAFSSLNATSG